MKKFSKKQKKLRKNASINFESEVELSIWFETEDKSSIICGFNL